MNNEDAIKRGRAIYEQMLIEEFNSRVEAIGATLREMGVLQRQAKQRREAGIASDRLQRMERSVGSITHGILLGIQIDCSDATLEDIMEACRVLATSDIEETVTDKLITAGIDPDEWPEIVEDER